MTMYSQTHLILLKQLAVLPLQPKTEFYPDAVKPFSAELADCNQPVVITEFEATNLAMLVADIECTLVSLGITDWQINPDADGIHLHAAQLITPTLETLKQPMLKRQLWSLLSEYVDA